MSDTGGDPHALTALTPSPPSILPGVLGTRLAPNPPWPPAAPPCPELLSSCFHLLVREEKEVEGVMGEMGEEGREEEEEDEGGGLAGDGVDSVLVAMRAS